ncbi:MAG: 50S ribosomal protein L29 [Bacteroidaceae bacterium]|nr:50S ribosomal protein L29 [Bacteroidaceae bacterium]
MKNAEIREIATKELEERLETEVQNYTQTLLTHSISPVADTSKIKAMRRNIARIKTELRQRELNK